MSQPPLFFFASYIMLSLEQPHNSINIDKALSLLQHHLWKVAEY